jgi:glycosyltransferase involved in cell wall biosynthesis
VPSPADLAVLVPDPRFGGGASAQTAAFVDGAAALGRQPELLYRAHPTLAGRRLTVDRVEALRQLRAGRSLRDAAAAARSTWVVSPLASHGLAAARSGRRYGCWIGTSLDDEWRGRARGLDPARRLAQRVNAPLLRRFEREVIGGAAAVWATSPASRSALAATGAVAEDAIRLLPLPVDVERFAPEPDDAWLARLARPTLAFVGRGDDPRKNVDLLLDALPAIRTRIPDLRALLVGSPPARRVDGAETAGHVRDLPPLLRTASLLVLPSWQEGFGIVAAEALASGVPVVTTPSGGPEHLVRTSEGGRVLSGWTAEELAATVVELLEAPGTLVAMRRSARDHVLREHAPERFRALLAEALAEV